MYRNIFDLQSTEKRSGGRSVVLDEESKDKSVDNFAKLLNRHKKFMVNLLTIIILKQLKTISLFTLLLSSKCVESRKREVNIKFFCNTLKSKKLN